MIPYISVIGYEIWNNDIQYHFNFKTLFLSAESDQATSGFYAKPVSIGDFTKHCAQRRKYPVLLKLEFNNAIKEREIQPSRHGTRKVNIEKNQNPRVVPCKCKLRLGVNHSMQYDSA